MERNSPRENHKARVTISGVNSDGHGITRIENFVVFVEGGLPGDSLEIMITKAERSFCRGKILEVISPSPNRVMPKCPFASRCGGCQWQHCDYNAQLVFKRQIVADALERIGGLKNAPVLEVLRMDNPWGYRNKGVFPVSENAIGMYAGNSHELVKLTDCAIQHPKHASLLEAVQKYLSKYKAHLESVTLRTGFATNETMVILNTALKKLPKEDELVLSLINAGASTALAGSRIIFGDGFIHERLGKIMYKISAGTFFQVNPVQAEALYATASGFAGKDITAADAHAGAGGIALYAAEKLQDITGIDIAPQTVADARENASLNGIKNAEFVCGPSEELIPKLFSQASRPELIFLDPPRKGCGTALLDAIISQKIPHLVYIACDPATMARDIKRLTLGSYALESVQPVDMFPMTAHVEAVAKLRYMT